MDEIKVKTPPTRWEYYFHPRELGGWTSVPRLGTEDDVNDLGRSGWELVTIFPVNVGYGQTTRAVFVFKRPLG